MKKINLIIILFLIFIDNPLLSSKIDKNSRIAFIGNNLCSRMINYGYFETELYLRYPTSKLFIRNLCDGVNTAGFRPHSGRYSHWAFKGAEKFNHEYNVGDSLTWLGSRYWSNGHFESPDEWLDRLNIDIIIGFFGYNESFRGIEGLKDFKNELSGFIEHTLNQVYNNKSPEIILISPISFQDLSKEMDLPKGTLINKNLELYSNAMKEIAIKYNILFIDVYTPSKKWFDLEKMTIDGSQLNDNGYKRFSKYIIERITNKKIVVNNTEKYENIKKRVLEKNKMWLYDYKIPNGVHVYGRRYDPFGPDNYPKEIKKIRQLTDNRDKSIWAELSNKRFNLKKSDAKTIKLNKIKSNYKFGNYGHGNINPKSEINQINYLSEKESINSFVLAPGYKIELFASERDFPDLANPVQLSFDNKGRLWVATMPSYPHFKPGDKYPNDKLLILEDTNFDGKADKQTTFADNLHLPVGFEFDKNGVYVSQGTNLVFLSDNDGDDKADYKEIVLSGFDDHDTHHNISAFSADPSGAIYMGQGVFLHANIETSYGPIHGTNGGFFRYNPTRAHLERTVQNFFIPNPWGIAFDKWGQNFFTDTSGPEIRWMMPASIKPLYGVGTKKTPNLVEKDHQVRPTSGLEFISSSHFPDDIQGDILVNNTIGFLGTKQHEILDDGTGYKFKFRQDLLTSDDRNFRPVDLEFAPDGSLYIVDWHNALIGHMQHNARDPLRDHSHGRIYRITYPSRPLVDPPKIHDATIEELFENLKLKEYRARYRTKRELRSRDPESVIKILKQWVKNLDKNDKNYEINKLEALWVSWGLNKVEYDLLTDLLNARDYKIRAAATRVLRYSGHQISDHVNLMKKSANDKHGRVRLEAIVAASWMKKKSDGESILKEAQEYDLDDWMKYSFDVSSSHLKGKPIFELAQKDIVNADLKGFDLALYKEGHKIYNNEGSCVSCHQIDGKGLRASNFPPLSNTDWVNGDKTKLIKILLKGLYGKIIVNDEEYNGMMSPYEEIHSDIELAAILTYIRNSFGNQSSPIQPEEVRAVRKLTSNRKNPYSEKDF